jgi:hypothetical protein
VQLAADVQWIAVSAPPEPAHEPPVVTVVVVQLMLG